MQRQCREAGSALFSHFLPYHLLVPDADGQTGSGKTYTMLGGGDGGEAGGRDDASRGLIQRVFEHLVRGGRVRRVAAAECPADAPCTWALCSAMHP